MNTWFFPLSHFSSTATQEAADMFGSRQLLIRGPDSFPQKHGVWSLQHKHIVGVQICSRGLHLREGKTTFLCSVRFNLNRCNIVLHLKTHPSTWNTTILTEQYHEMFILWGPHDMNSMLWSYCYCTHFDCKTPFSQNLYKAFSLVL